MAVVYLFVTQNNFSESARAQRHICTCLCCCIYCWDMQNQV